MKVLKWDITCTNYRDSNELLENGWEPFAAQDTSVFFRRPVGYIEVEEKVVKEQSKPVVTKELSFNLDKIEKYENQVSEPEISGNCKNTEDGIEY